MNQQNRTKRQIIKNRAKANRAARRPKSLASHLIGAGAETKAAQGVANALRTVAKRVGVTGKRGLTARTSDGKVFRKEKKRVVFRYTIAQVRSLVTNYKPRKAEYKAAVALLG